MGIRGPGVSPGQRSKAGRGPGGRAGGHRGGGPRPQLPGAAGIQPCGAGLPCPGGHRRRRRGLGGAVTAAPPRSVPGLFLERVDRSPDAVAFTVRDDAGFVELPPEWMPPGPSTAAPPGWRHLSLGQALASIAGLAVRLRSLGVGRGSRVAILAETSHAWCALDLAVLSLGGITVGIYPTLTGKEVAWQLRHSRAELLVVDDDRRHAPVAPFLDQLDDLRHVFAMKPDQAVPPLAPGRPDEAMLRAQIAAVGPDDVATVVYTSGTTGRPKGVVLTHGHFLANILGTRQRWPLPPGQRSIVFLPLAHSLQRFATYRGLVEDISGWFSPSLDDLPEVIAASRPTILVTVPRMLEKIRARAQARAASRGPIPAALMRWAELVGVAIRHHRVRGSVPPRRLRLQAALADRLVARRVRDGLGGALHTVISGGAALSPDVALWFEAMGIAVRQGWGLTETCAPATLETDTEFRLGTVGRPLPDTEVRIADDGEVLVRGPGVFRAYLDDPAATAAAFLPDPDGGAPWFRTGDLGTVDADGYLRITGRKKAIIVTAGGKNIAPAPLEKALEGGIIGQALVVGDERPYLVALLTLDEEALAARARAGGWPGDADAWRQRPEVQAEVADRVARLNETLPRFSTIKRFAVLPRPWTVEAGELTPTLKLKRRVVEARYAADIAALYG
ncbi:MAG: long-chain fatty acid--CoA ligase [Deltaproteobacteria bacterium]|nr:MAG: long-chain fatty acid--CoA ligase [Deltaproteobacteria bacterium]